MINGNGLLYIEPKRLASKEPIIDVYTRRMAAALSKAFKGAWTGRGSRADGFEIGNGWKGLHLCVCGCSSGSQDLLLSTGVVTNSLATHYLAYHRDEVPEEELAKVMQLPDEEVDPVLMTPERIRGSEGESDPPQLVPDKGRRVERDRYMEFGQVFAPYVPRVRGKGTMTKSKRRVTLGAIIAEIGSSSREGVRIAIEAEGFDGLYDTLSECGCGVEELFPCGKPPGGCRLGVRAPCPSSCGVHDYHIVPGIPRPTSRKASGDGSGGRSGVVVKLSPSGERPICAYLSDGSKIIVRRDSGTVGAAWLEHVPQDAVVPAPVDEPLSK